MAALRAAVFPLSAKKPKGRAFFAPPPSSARVKSLLLVGEGLLIASEGPSARSASSALSAWGSDKN